MFVWTAVGKPVSASDTGFFMSVQQRAFPISKLILLVSEQGMRNTLLGPVGFAQLFIFQRQGLLPL